MVSLNEETLQTLIALFHECLHELEEQSETLIDEEKRDEIFRLTERSRETIKRVMK